jgi:hypothetical protein
VRPLSKGRLLPALTDGNSLVSFPSVIYLRCPIFAVCSRWLSEKRFGPTILAPVVSRAEKCGFDRSMANTAVLHNILGRNYLENTDGVEFSPSVLPRVAQRGICFQNTDGGK